MRARNAFLILGMLFCTGAAYFAFELVTGAPNAGEIIVLPIYIGFALILAAVCFAVGIVLQLRRRK